MVDTNVDLKLSQHLINELSPPTNGCHFIHDLAANCREGRRKMVPRHQRISAKWKKLSAWTSRRVGGNKRRSLIENHSLGDRQMAESVTNQWPYKDAKSMRSGGGVCG